MIFSLFNPCMEIGICCAPPIDKSQIFMNVHISSLGMFAIRADRDYVVQEDFMKAVRKVSDNKKLETKLDYKPV